MAIGVTNFPASLDTAAELIRVANIAASTIGAGGVTNVATTVPITDTTAFASDGVAWCGTEAIAYTAKTGSSITGCVRGFDGTTAASHAAGDPIYGDIITSKHHEVLVDAILGIEAAFGITNGSMAARKITDAGGQIYNVKAFGAVGNGVNDDTAEIQAAIDACGAAGGGTVYLPAGDYKISSTLFIGDGDETALSTTNSIGFVGDGPGVSDVLTVPHYASTELQWYGAAAGTMLEVRGPITGIHLSNFHLDGKTSTNAAGTLLKTTHMQQSTVSHVTGDRWSVLALDIQAYDAPTGTVEGARGVTWQNLHFTWPTVGTASGIRIGAALHGTTPFLDVAQNYFENVMVDVSLGVSTPTGSALILRFCDNLTFNHCGFGAEFTNGKSIDVQVPADDTSWPSTIVFYNCNLYGPVVVTGGPMTGIHGLTFLPLQTGDDARIPSGNVIRGVTTEGVWFGDWRALRTQSATLTDITESVSNNAIKVQMLHVEPSYYPGIIWYSSDNSPTRPKAGIFGQSTAAGTYFHIATSSNYGAGMNNIGFTQGPTGNIGVRTGVPTAALHLPAGTATASTAPLKLTSGTNLTTPEAGVAEYDGANLHWTHDTTSGRGRAAVYQEYRMTANGSASGSATITDFFPATSSLSLAASSVYMFEADVFFTKTTAGTMVWTLLASSAPTAMTLGYDGPGNAITVTNMGATTGSATVVTGATGSLSTAVNFFFHLRGTIETNAACNIRLRGTPSSGTFTALRNSVYRIRRIGSANTGIFVA
jgi:hypothetical protein